MKYVAFLRGINVGGNTKVPMADLKKLFENLGFTQVQTILNSGNVVFSSNKALKEETLEKELEEKFGFPITIIVKTGDQIKKIIQGFKNKPNSREVFYITFLKNDKEVMSVVDLSSKGTTDLMKELEKKYGKAITTRNWNTIIRIGEILTQF